MSFLGDVQNITFAKFNKFDSILNKKSRSIKKKIEIVVDVWRMLSKCNFAQSELPCIIQVIDWAKLHTLNMVLAAEWKKHKEKHENSLIDGIQATQEKLRPVNSAFLNRCQNLIKVVTNPWGNPTLNNLIQTPNADVGDEELQFFLSETTYLTSVRVKKLCESHCDDLALNLVKAFMKCYQKSIKENVNLATEAQMWFLFDVYVALLYHYAEKEFFNLLKDLSHTESLNFVKRFSKKRVNISPVWQNSDQIAKIAARIFIYKRLHVETRDSYDEMRELIAIFVSLYAKDEDLSEFQQLMEVMIQKSVSASVIYNFASAVHNTFGDKMKNLTVQLYVRGITTDVNLMEKQRDENQKEFMTDTAKRMTAEFMNLADVFKDNVKVIRECALTAFSLDPTVERLGLLEYYAFQNTSESYNELEWNCKLHASVVESDDSIWTCKDCDHEISKSEINQPVGSKTRLLGDDLTPDNLGISEIACNDLLLVISHPRYHRLSWRYEWPKLQRLCKMYLKNPERHQKFATVLKFLHIDYSAFENHSKQNTLKRLRMFRPNIKKSNNDQDSITVHKDQEGCSLCKHCEKYNIQDLMIKRRKFNMFLDPANLFDSQPYFMEKMDFQMTENNREQLFRMGYLESCFQNTSPDKVKPVAHNYVATTTTTTRIVSHIASSDALDSKNGQDAILLKVGEQVVDGKANMATNSTLLCGSPNMDICQRRQQSLDLITTSQMPIPVSHYTTQPIMTRNPNDQSCIREGKTSSNHPEANTLMHTVHNNANDTAHEFQQLFAPKDVQYSDMKMKKHTLDCLQNSSNITNGPECETPDSSPRLAPSDGANTIILDTQSFASKDVNSSQDMSRLSDDSTNSLEALTHGSKEGKASAAESSQSRSESVSKSLRHISSHAQEVACIGAPVNDSIINGSSLVATSPINDSPAVTVSTKNVETIDLTKNEVESQLNSRVAWTMSQELLCTENVGVFYWKEVITIVDNAVENKELVSNVESGEATTKQTENVTNPALQTNCKSDVIVISDSPPRKQKILPLEERRELAKKEPTKQHRFSNSTSCIKNIAEVAQIDNVEDVIAVSENSPNTRLSLDNDITSVELRERNDSPIIATRERLVNNSSIIDLELGNNDAARNAIIIPDSPPPKGICPLIVDSKHNLKESTVQNHFSNTELNEPPSNGTDTLNTNREENVTALSINPHSPSRKRRASSFAESERELARKEPRLRERPLKSRVFAQGTEPYRNEINTSNSTIRGGNALASFKTETDHGTKLTTEESDEELHTKSYKQVVRDDIYGSNHKDISSFADEEAMSEESTDLLENNNSVKNLISIIDCQFKQLMTMKSSKRDALESTPSKKRRTEKSVERNNISNNARNSAITVGKAEDKNLKLGHYTSKVLLNDRTQPAVDDPMFLKFSYEPILFPSRNESMADVKDQKEDKNVKSKPKKSFKVLYNSSGKTLDKTNDTPEVKKQKDESVPVVESSSRKRRKKTILMKCKKPTKNKNIRCRDGRLSCSWRCRKKSDSCDTEESDDELNVNKDIVSRPTNKSRVNKKRKKLTFNLKSRRDMAQIKATMNPVVKLVHFATLHAKMMLKKNVKKVDLVDVPGMNDMSLFQPDINDIVVNVAQLDGNVDEGNTNMSDSQTGTQITPHIQRVGQPRVEKNEHVATPSTSTKPAALINILSQQIIKPGFSDCLKPRPTPLINIVSQQIIKPPMSCSSVQNKSRQVNDALVTEAVSKQQITTTSTTTKNSTTKETSGSTSTPVPGTILQFICKSATLPKFQQAFGKTVYQTSSGNRGEVVASETDNSTNNADASNFDAAKKTQTKSSTLNLQPIQGSVIYTRQVSAGQAINLIPPGRQVFRIATTNPEQLSLVKDSVIRSKMSALLTAALQGKKGAEVVEIQTTTKDGGTEIVEKVTGVRQTLVQNTARLVKPGIEIPSNVTKEGGSNAIQSNLSSTTLEQLREFDMVYKQIKERSNTSGIPITAESQQKESQETSSTTQGISVTYLNQQGQKFTQLSPLVVVSSNHSNLQSAVSPALSVTSQGSSSPCVTPAPTPTLPKTSTKTSSKGKSLKTSPTQHLSKSSPLPKPQQKPQEDEHTTQRIFDILAEYAEQLRNSPDLNNKPAPRRRSNPPTNPNHNSKRKKNSTSKKNNNGTGGTGSSGGGTISESDLEDQRTIGSEDSSCGILQLSKDEEQALNHTTESNDSTTSTRPLILTETNTTNSNAARSLIIADSNVGEALKLQNTAVLVPGNYIMPVSMVKSGQQIAVVSGGSKILATVPSRSGHNMLLFQSFLNQNRKPGVPTVKYSALQPISGVSAQNLGGQSSVILPQNAHNLTTVTLGQPLTIKKVEESENRVNTEFLLAIAQPRDKSTTSDSGNNVTHPDSSSTNIPNGAGALDNCSSIKPDDSNNGQSATNSSSATYSKITLDSSIATPVISQISHNKNGTNANSFDPPQPSIIKLNITPDINADDTKTAKRVQSVLVTACTSNVPMLSSTLPHYRKPSDSASINAEVNIKRDYLHNGEKQKDDIKHFHTATVFFPGKNKKGNSTSNTAKIDKELQQLCLQRKQAVLERELRLQKSLSEECEDLGVDEPSTSDLFPEADLLFDSNHSPSFDQNSQDIGRRTPLHHQENKEKSISLFNDYDNSSSVRNDFLFNSVQYPTTELQYEQTEQLTNGGQSTNSNESGSFCEDSTLLQNCTSMSDVTLNSPISPEYATENSTHINKYKFKYSNRKKIERHKQAEGGWTGGSGGEVSSSEDTICTSSDLGKISHNSKLRCLMKRSGGSNCSSSCDEDEFKVVRIAISKTDLEESCGESHFNDELDPNSGRGARRSVKKTCPCCNGAQEDNNRKRPSSQPQTAALHKKAFLTKKR